MKLDPHLPPLPSLSELLEHPRVKGVVERINRSTLAHRAAGYLEEMRRTLAARTGRIELPSVTQLADRFVRRLLSEPAGSGPLVNATGLVFGDPQVARPLPEASLNAMFHAASEFHQVASVGSATLEREVREATGAEAVFVASNLDVALLLTIAATSANREFTLTCSGALADSPIDWQRLAVRSGAVVRQARTDVVDEQSLEAVRNVAAVVRAPDAEDLELAALAESAHKHSACLIDVAPIAGLLDPSLHGFSPVATVGQRLAAGADLVIFDGGGLLGGPACGIVAGRRALIELIGAYPLAPMVAADPLTLVALAAAWEAYGRDAAAPVVLQLPVWQLLSAPLANLQQRAIRMAELMAESPAIASVEPLEGESPWRRWGSRVWTAPTWGIKLLPATGDGPLLQKHLREGLTAVAARADESSVTLDLRTVFPRWDQRIVAAVEAIGR